MQVVCNIPVDEILCSLNMISSYSASHPSRKIKSALEPAGFNENGLVSSVEQMIIDGDIFAKCTSKGSDRYYALWQTIPDCQIVGELWVKLRSEKTVFVLVLCIASCFRENVIPVAVRMVE
jgi:hypothetical protein